MSWSVSRLTGYELGFHARSTIGQNWSEQSRRVERRSSYYLGFWRCGTAVTVPKTSRLANWKKVRDRQPLATVTSRKTNQPLGNLPSLRSFESWHRRGGLFTSR